MGYNSASDGNLLELAEVGNFSREARPWSTDTSTVCAIVTEDAPVVTVALGLVGLMWPREPYTYPLQETHVNGKSRIHEPRIRRYLAVVITFGP